MMAEAPAEHVDASTGCVRDFRDALQDTFDTVAQKPLDPEGYQDLILGVERAAIYRKYLSLPRKKAGKGK